MNQTPKARDLRIVTNNTRDWTGGYTVEYADGTVLAGPYVTKDAAKEAKQDLVAGRPLRQWADGHFN